MSRQNLFIIGGLVLGLAACAHTTVATQTTVAKRGVASSSLFVCRGDVTGMGGGSDVLEVAVDPQLKVLQINGQSPLQLSNFEYDKNTPALFFSTLPDGSAAVNVKSWPERVAKGGIQMSARDDNAGAPNHAASFFVIGNGREIPWSGNLSCENWRNAIPFVPPATGN